MQSYEYETITSRKYIDDIAVPTVIQAVKICLCKTGMIHSGCRRVDWS